MRCSLPLVSLLAGLAGFAGIAGCALDDQGASEGESDTGDPGSLCACREIEGVSECCFGHGQCLAQPQGPDRCECDEGALGETCSTPAPGVHAVRERACSDDDPGCTHGFEHVVVEAFDSCTDLDGQRFDGLVVRPASGSQGAWPSGDPLPLMVLTHGASQHHADYYDLLEHVAANGIVAASFDASAGASVTARANRTLSFLQCLHAQWPDAQLLSPRTALVGHSRGGSAVAVAAEAIADGLAVPELELVAVVALAPTQSDVFALSGTATPAYFTLQGSRDPDTRGASLAWFDRAGQAAPTFIRGLAWVFGATHHRFHQGLLFAGSGELQASLDAEGHWTVARAYIGGFVIWRLLQRDAYRRFFIGAEIPASVAQQFDGPPGVFAGLTDGVGARTSVHDFEADALSPASNGALVSSSGFVDLQLGPLAQLDPPWSSAHLDRGLRVDWQAGQAGALLFELPVDAQDLRAYASLSLRLARVFDGSLDDCSEAGPSAGISVVLHDANTSVELTLTEFGEAGRIEPPDRFVPELFGNWVSDSCHALDFLRALRLPLQRFCDAGLDLSAVVSIELRVDGSEAGGLLLDDLALELGEGELAGCL